MADTDPQKAAAQEATGKAAGSEGQIISAPADGKGASLQGELQKKVDELNGELTDIRKELRRDKVSFVEFCGLFVAIFTFISIEIQIFRFICDFDKIIGFTFIFAGLLIGFIFMVDFLLHNNNGKVYWIKFVVLLCVLIGLIWIGLDLVHQSKESDWRCETTEKSPSLSNSMNLPESIKVELLPK